MGSGSCWTGSGCGLRRSPVAGPRGVHSAASCVPAVRRWNPIHFMLLRMPLHPRRSVHRMRLPGYDYGWPGGYMVTACTAERSRIFGRVLDGAMHLSPAGQIVLEEWWRAAAIRPNVALDVFVVMPDHIHGIVGLSRWDGSPAIAPPASIPTLMQQFKSITTKRINAVWGTSGVPVWQRGYHDRIIPDERALIAMRRYVIANPRKWNAGRDAGR